MKKAKSSRRLLATAVAAAIPLTTVLGPSASAEQTYYVPVTKSWAISGHGYGHGHGMSQYGAQGAALQGLTYDKILGFYYPGTTLAAAKGRVRVLISSDTTSDVQVRPARGLTVRDLSDRATFVLPTDNGADTWRLWPRATGRTAVQFHTAAGWSTYVLPGRRTLPADGEFSARVPLTLMVPSGSTLVPRKYRGILRIARPYAGATVRDTINVLSLDDYTRGVVPDEMPPSWEQEALRSQAVAARTYGAWLRAQNSRRYYQICDTTACQVYGGVNAEASSTNQAVVGTAGKILTYSGSPAFTQFSASSGGWTSDGGVPYLPARRDPYDGWSGNHVHDWSTTINTSAVEAAHPEIGTLIALKVESREGDGQWGGRVLQIVLDGTDADAYITGDDFRWEHGLRSTWFSIAPTPIMARWARIGGADSAIGNPKTGEYAVGSGSVQRFERGRIFWNSVTGARDLRAGILRTYLQLGGPNAVLGWPRTAIMQSPNNGRRASFQRGVIWAKSGLGAHAVYGPILARYLDLGAVRSPLGYPTSSVYTVRVGRRVNFQHGSITYNSSTKTTIVRYS